MSKHTPGPFEANGDAVQERQTSLSDAMQMMPVSVCRARGCFDEYRAEDVADLMNKGSHFDELADALEAFTGAVGKGIIRARPSDREKLIAILASARAALAKAGRE